MLPVNVELNDIREWLASKKDADDVKQFLYELSAEKPLTAETVSSFLGTEEGKSLIQPMMDQRVTEAIQTYRKGHFDKEVRASIAAELLKINPAETSEQKRLRELEERDARREKEWEREKLRGNIKEIAFRESVNPKFIEALEFTTVEEAALYIKNFKAEIEAVKTAKANEIMASGFKPGSGADASKKGGITPQEYAKLPFEERIRMVESGEADKIVN